jgi:signal transduction histidine kinase
MPTLGPEAHAQGGRGGALLRSAGVRFAAIYAALLSLSAVALALFLWWATVGLLDRKTEQEILADSHALALQWDEGGLQGLVTAIDERLAQNTDDDVIYLLVDRSRRRVAGNLSRWPEGVEGSDTWYDLAIERAGSRLLSRVAQFDLPGGFHLLVGRDIVVHARLLSLVTDALPWAIGVVLVMASLGALLVRGLFRRMLANVSATATAIAGGDFTQRVRLSGKGDEFDQLAETINEMLDRIARLMDGVREVSNAIAHDLRTPIARARSRLEDASLHAEGPAELRAAIERATADLDGIATVFQALLRIAEIEAGARRSAFTSFDLAPLLSDLTELYGAVAEERESSVEMQAPEHMPAYGDAAMIQQAVANLLDNAVKFSPPGVTVRLLAAARPHAIEISVIDRGPGIPPDDHARVTERFFRGEQARSTPGAGLGLALVLAVAQLHGGTLRLTDAAPGLCAVLSLPLPDAAPRG